jgi:hypothetical protein
MTRDEKENQIREHLKAGGTGINHEQAELLIAEIDRLRSTRREHANIHYSYAEFIGIDGYGPFSLRMLCKDRWEVQMLREKVILYNRKGKRVRADIDNTDTNYDGDW